MQIAIEEHICNDVDNFPLDKYFQNGVGNGRQILIVGESPAENGWRKSGKAFYSLEGKLLATGKRLNELLLDFDLDVTKCGFTELSKCFLGANRKNLNECCRKCWPIFEKQINTNGCKLIVTLGVIPAQIVGEMLNENINMGVIKEVIIGGNERNLLPIFHPSPVNPYGRAKNKKIFKKYYREIMNIIRD